MNTHMCVVCDKTFNSKGNVSRHLKAIHGVQHAPKRGARHMGIICGICKKEFFDKATLTRHTAKVHKLSQHVVYDKNKNIRCEECKVAFSCKKQLIRHLVALHEFEEVYIQQEFMRIEDFREWLKCEEESNKVEYSRVNGKTIGKQFSRYLYECNRSGKPPNTCTRKRLQKSQGSVKIGYACTSHIIIKVNNSTGAVHMKYLKTHYGHTFELQHIRIPESSKTAVASKLSLGVSVPKIINSVRDSIDENALQRVDLITKKDISNIRKSFGLNVLDGVRHSDDAISVALWAKECLNDKNNPILFYKTQGSEDTVYSLDTSDFCLILMNKFQMEAIGRFANKFICIDSTHGTNPYDFELTTLMVSDDFGEGMPVAYMIANRTDTRVCEIFFINIKAAVGHVATNTFMSDITNIYYNAWVSVMGTVSNRLYCSWHIDRAWKSNLMKICCINREDSIEKRKKVYKALKVLQTTLDNEKFEKYYEEFLTELCNDPDTKSFYEYFCNNYGNNYLSWAYCYRKELQINTNMYLESMHRIIKYEYLEGKKVKRLDKSLHNLLRFTRDKQVERLIKLTKGKTTDRLTAINSSHKRAIDSNFSCERIETSHDDYQQWSVCNLKKETTYVVTEKTPDTCCALICQTCRVCYHSYSCTCVDYFIKSNICKHIHFIRIQNFEDASNTLSNSESKENSVHEEIESSLKSLSKESRDSGKLQNTLVDKALEVVALARKCTVPDILTTALKQVTASSLLLKMDGETKQIPKFQMTEATKMEPSNKKIMKQISFFSTKKRRKQLHK
ncbi:hypothetical protein PPYR_02321 [Photinus pyralis]|uniref:C2H2-type domain-containing protein n=2 Tax=Photinus pyralis TaxID=7054 RepID=A0A1Y1MFB4_PHOPY|nr:uncharacterized protein LOC116177583 [Photinus pyralis]KAB0805351.1 hypothetical protein PPYR_02321 [Photinus pyralis]